MIANGAQINERRETAAWKSRANIGELAPLFSGGLIKIVAELNFLVKDDEYIFKIPCAIFRKNPDSFKTRFIKPTSLISFSIKLYFN